MDSIPCLVGPDTSLTSICRSSFLPARQRDMEKDDPIPRHLKLHVGLVAARLSFLRLCEQGPHARVRHLSLNHNVRPGNRLGAGIRQVQSERSTSDPRRLRRDFVVNCDRGWQLDRPGTAA